MNTRATELQSYRGEWEPKTDYQYGDIVKVRGMLYICDMQHTSETSFNEKEESLFTAFDTYTNNEGSLQKGLLKMLHHLPIIHTPKSYGDRDGDIVINYPYEEVPNNSLLFVVPLRGSNNISNRLVIKHPQLVTTNGTTKVEYPTNKTKEYTIYIENHDGSKRQVKSGDIVPDRLCIFRFLSASSNIVILCNNPIYDNLHCSTLTITNETIFYRQPSIIGANNQTVDTLALSSDVKSVKDTADSLKERIQTGTQSAEDFFDAHPELPAGTIYLQMEE